MDSSSESEDSFVSDIKLPLQLASGEQLEATKDVKESDCYLELTLENKDCLGIIDILKEEQREQKGFQIFPKQIVKELPDFVANLRTLLDSGWFCAVVIPGKHLLKGTDMKIPSGVLTDVCLFSHTQPVLVLTCVRPGTTCDIQRYYNSILSSEIEAHVVSKLDGNFSVAHGVVEYDWTSDSFANTIKNLQLAAQMTSFSNSLLMSRGRCLDVARSIVCIVSNDPDKLLFKGADPNTVESRGYTERSMLPRRVRNAPSDSLTTLPSDTSSVTIQWERDIDVPEFEMSESVSDDDDEYGTDSGYNYTDDEFEDYSSEDDESHDSVEGSVKCIDIGNGIRLITPKDADFDIRVEPLLAEIRTDILKTLRHHNDEILVSDAFGVSHLMADMQLTLRVPVVIPSTRLHVSKLLRFHVRVMTKDGWKEISAGYKDHSVEFTAKNPQLFLVYARPIAEFYRVTADGRTIVSDKDNNIQIEVPEGAVDGETYMRVRVNPIDNDRIARYREHDPSAFDGILALTDILSLSHTMDRVFRGSVAVQLPMNQTVDGEHEVRYYNINHKQYSHIGHTVNTSQQSNVNMTCAVGPNMRCQAVCVQPGVSEEDSIRAAMFGANFIHRCSVLMYISKFKGDRFLTVEVVSSNNADEVSTERLNKGFYEILNSRSHIEVNNSDRIRLSLGGNIENVTEKRKTKLSFLYSATSVNNWIQFKTRKSGSGTPYCIIIVLVGARRVQEVHFDYPDAGKKLAEITNLYERVPSPGSSVASSDTGYRSRTAQTRPKTATTASTVHTDTHLFSTRSIMELSQIVTLVLCQRVLLYLNFNYDKAFKEAQRNKTNPVFLSFLRWYEDVRISTPVNTLADDFIDAFVKNGRNDIAKAIKRARRHKRHLTQEDIQKYT